MISPIVTECLLDNFGFASRQIRHSVPHTRGNICGATGCESQGKSVKAKKAKVKFHVSTSIGGTHDSRNTPTTPQTRGGRFARTTCDRNPWRSIHRQAISRSPSVPGGDLRGGGAFRPTVAAAQNEGAALMWCGPSAVAALIGWTPDQVWLHVRAVREQKGQRLTDLPVGGTHVWELEDAVKRAGYQLIPVFRNRRMRYHDFRLEYRTGKYLCHQSRHLFAHIGCKPWRGAGRGIILDAWRLERAPHKESCP